MSRRVVTDCDRLCRVPRALLSVYDKTGIVEFARDLRALGWELLSSGGTAKKLNDADVEVVDVATLTGYPAILGHRVVTLHPAIHAALLADIDDATHRADLATYGIAPIALAVVNLYPFNSDPSIDLIDVGGPAMVRAAAKNHKHVGVVVEPSQYPQVIAELRGRGGVSAETRRNLAVRAFEVTAAYDSRIAGWLAQNTASDVVHESADTVGTAGESELPAHLTIQLERETVLRYGENPHQRGARYRVLGERSWWSDAQQLGGKEMSYLNVYDADAAWSLVNKFEEPSAVVIKHANPCGVAVAKDIETAYERAHACDPVSAFGGIVGLNRPMTKAAAEALSSSFTEVIVAPDFEPEALNILKSKKNLRVIRARAPFGEGLSLRRIDGGMLVQTRDEASDDVSSWRVASAAQPTSNQLRDAAIAWVVCAAVSSNAIVIVRDGCAIGIGAGQQSRVDAAKLACARAGERAQGSAAASDAFFPFRDGPDLLAKVGVSIIVQPGGSQRDDDSIASANEHGIVMLMTNVRHFRH